MALQVMDNRKFTTDVRSAASTRRSVHLSGAAAIKADNAASDGQVGGQRPQPTASAQASPADLISQLAAVRHSGHNKAMRKESTESGGMGWGVLLCTGTVALAAVAFVARKPLSQFLSSSARRDSAAPLLVSARQSQAVAKLVPTISAPVTTQSASKTYVPLPVRTKKKKLVPLPIVQLATQPTSGPSPKRAATKWQAPQSTKSTGIKSVTTPKQPAFDPRNPPGALFTGQQ